jgi:nucleotide-binding universal stress UspA family protein
VADLSAVLQEQERGARAQLERLGGQWRKRLPKLRTIRLIGSPAMSVVAAARKLKADIIVIATHGRTGLSHLFLGSVAERIVRTARCPVLTVPSSTPVKRPRAGRRAASKTAVARAA